MDIQINYDYRKEDLEKLPLHELTQFVLAREDKPFNTEVSISFVTDEAIAELNERYRHKEGPTDVLSFECDGVDDDLSAMTLAEDPVFELGDVIIAPDVASRQMREFGTTFEEEISLLLVHGLLHLCGYDHIEDDEAEVMEKREAEILPLALKGRTGERIAAEFFISKSTVDTHLRRIYVKTGMHGRQELIDLGERTARDLSQRG